MNNKITYSVAVFPTYSPATSIGVKRTIAYAKQLKSFGCWRLAIKDPSRRLAVERQCIKTLHNLSITTSALREEWILPVL